MSRLITGIVILLVLPALAFSVNINGKDYKEGVIDRQDKYKKKV